MHLIRNPGVSPLQAQTEIGNRKKRISELEKSVKDSTDQHNQLVQKHTVLDREMTEKVGTAEYRIRLVKLTSTNTTCVISSPNTMFDHLLESSHQEDSNKWSNTGFCEEITQVAKIEVHFTLLIWSY